MSQTRPAPPRQLSRLQIPPGMSNQPVTFDGKPLFSPGHHQSASLQFHPALNPQMLSSPGPQQGYFPMHQPPQMHQSMHRSRPSMVNISGANLPLPLPPTPGGVHLGYPQVQPMYPGMPPPSPGGLGLPGGFVPRSRRNMSVSIGGPPKAALGGPSRNKGDLSKVPGTPLATPLINDTPVSDTLKPKGKKMVVKLPVETIGDSSERPSFARDPMRVVVNQLDVPPPDISTMELPYDLHDIDGAPSTIEVFLPGKGAWEEYKQAIMEEKLAKLGVERGSGFVPGHSRPASISSPADPALLLYKLNKLHQLRSLEVSPQPSQFSEASSQGAYTSSRLPRHGHSMSLAAVTSQPQFSPSQNPNQLLSPYPSTAESNPFGPHATLPIPPHYKRSPLTSSSLLSVSEADDDEAVEQDSSLPLFAPQAKTPIHSSAFEAPTLPEPDFTIGFGLDVSDNDEDADGEESDGEAEAEEGPSISFHTADPGEDSLDGMTPPATASLREFGQHHPLSHAQPEIESVDQDVIDDGKTEGAFTTPSHSRHVSRVSAIFVPTQDSGIFLPPLPAQEDDPWLQPPRPDDGDGDEKENIPPVEYPSWPGASTDTEEWAALPKPDSHEPDWTGSMDGVEGHVEFVTDTESTGEWSNPSDEERHREERRTRAAQRNSTQFAALSGVDATFGIMHNPPQSDDMISNPSEEGEFHYDNVSSTPQNEAAFYAGEGSHRGPDIYPHSRPGSSRLSRPLPVPPQSGGNSNAASPSPGRSAAHSRNPSHAAPMLNPFAKPFVFGGMGRQSPAASATFSAGSATERFASPKPSGHARQLSMGSRLNAAAVEFKPSFGSAPTGFNFRPPPGVPSLTFPTSTTSEVSRPLPEIPPSPRAAQGREKRQRRGSSAGVGEGDGVSPGFDNDGGDPERDDVTSFQFPPPHLASLDLPEGSSPKMPRRGSILNPTAKPFTFGGFSLAPALAALGSVSAPASVPETLRSKRSAQESVDQDEAEVPNSAPAKSTELPDVTPSFETQKSRRPPIPSFQHPVSTNTVPASLFKALAGGDGEGPTRPTVRSRLSSRELYEHHGKNGSLDDINLPSIARRANRMIPTHLNDSNTSVDLLTQSPEEGPHLQFDRPHSMNETRRLSLPLLQSSSDAGQSPSINAERYERRLEELLDDRFGHMRRELFILHDSNAEHNHPTHSTLLTNLVPTIKDQLQAVIAEHQDRLLNDSRVDAQGEMDYEMIHNIIEQGHHELRASLQRDIAELAQGLEAQAHRRPDPNRQIFQLMEDLAGRTLSSMDNVTSRIIAHLDARDELTRRRPLEEQQQLLQDMINVLVPHINTLRTEPFDIDRLTLQLSQAVKPHISQLIDLASDKSETAALIVQHLLPTFRSLIPPQLDTVAISRQICEDVVQAVPQVDHHGLKEDVADLVVERLNSRLAVRDSALNPEIVVDRVTELLASHLQRSSETSIATDALLARNEILLSQHANLQSKYSDISTSLMSVPETLVAAAKALDQAQGELLSKTRAITEFEDLQRVISANTELQLQLTKARSLHGQVRSEKDILTDRLAEIEADRDHHKSSTTTLQAELSSKGADLVSAEAKYIQLEDKLAQVLGKLALADEKLQSKDAEVTSLERTNRDLSKEASELKSKLNNAEVEAVLAVRDLKASEAAQRSLEIQRDDLLAGQTHWNDLRRTADQVESLAKLLGRVEKEEHQELQRSRSRINVLEGELSSLQKRYAEQDAKLGSLQRASITSKQSVANAQQRSSEWEKKANEREKELEALKFKLEQSEDVRSQIDAEVTSYGLQIEEHENRERASKERENALKTQVSTLESELILLREQLTRSETTSTYSSYPRSVSSPSSYPLVGLIKNGRPASSLSQSTQYPSRPGTVTPGREPVNGRAGSQRYLPSTQGSVSDSMHAPRTWNNNQIQVPPTPRQQHASPHPISAVPPSPTLSTVSLTPTQRDDGWWA